MIFYSKNVIIQNYKSAKISAFSMKRLVFYNFQHMAYNV